MRKSIFLILTMCLILALASTAFAAKTKSYAPGTWYLSGDTELNLQFGKDTMEPKDGDSTDTNHTIFGLGTRAGYFIIDGLEIGLGLNYDYDKSTYKPAGASGDTTGTTSSYLAGLQGGYFFGLNGIDPFVMVLIGYNGMGSETKPDTGDKTTNTASGLGYDISAGINFLLTPRIGLAPALFYRGVNYSGEYKVGSDKSEYDNTISRYGLRVGINLFL